MNQAQGTEPYNAPVSRTIERQGIRTEPYTRRLPQIRGGVCEFCGVLDKHVPSQDQWRLCQHFRGIPEIRCSYCDEGKNPNDVNLKAILNIAEHPSDLDQNGNKTLVVWCNSYSCSAAHEKRFRVNR